ncbi:MAG: GerMN domain-containing protein [Candidatus Firestonebacteria bacterium]
MKKVLIILICVLSLYILFKLIKLVLYPNKETAIQYTTQRKSVKLFFVNEDGNLNNENREIITDKTILEDAKICMLELIKGPQKSTLISAIPSSTILRELYIDNNKCAYIDFNKGLIDNHPGGTAGELNTINSIIKTLTTNFEQINSVKFLIDGQEINTISGHIDISEPVELK